MNITQIGSKNNLEEIDKQLGETYWSPINVANINK